ncbi:RNP-1 like RNA-binding protein [Thermincola potens JR]|uniref:RNP-1 like RNA-binding protein n=1 Tax=Thermincola potens (strain JR) TaxID=635013 RepID=D5XBC2_THEPJ|nr:RNP-1 like RNA-binding protein [Thermincola potens JR]
MIHFEHNTTRNKTKDIKTYCFGFSNLEVPRGCIRQLSVFKKGTWVQETQVPFKLKLVFGYQHSTKGWASVFVSVVAEIEREVKVLVRTLYVGNLPWATKPEELAEAFAAHGKVVGSRIITDRETGRSRGFGFVEVEDEDADRLIAEMNGKEFNGRVLTVNEAKPRGEGAQ